MLFMNLGCFCIAVKTGAAIFFIKQLDTYLPEQMQTHFPFCFFCFSVVLFFNAKRLATYFQSVSQCSEISTIEKYPVALGRLRHLN